MATLSKVQLSEQDKQIKNVIKNRCRIDKELTKNPQSIEHDHLSNMSNVIKAKRDMKSDIKSAAAEMRATTKLEENFADSSHDQIVAGVSNLGEMKIMCGNESVIGGLKMPNSSKRMRSNLNLIQSKLSFSTATRVTKPFNSFSKLPTTNARSAIADVKPPTTITTPSTAVIEPATIFTKQPIIVADMMTSQTKQQDGQ